MAALIIAVICAFESPYSPGFVWGLENGENGIGKDVIAMLYKHWDNVDISRVGQLVLLPPGI